jgi:hypothetical protein
MKDNLDKMGKVHTQQDRSSVFKRFRRHRQPSTSSSSFRITDQQQKDRDSFINQTSNNNKRSK